MAGEIPIEKEGWISFRRVQDREDRDEGVIDVWLKRRGR